MQSIDVVLNKDYNNSSNPKITQQGNSRQQALRSKISEEATEETDNVGFGWTDTPNVITMKRNRLIMCGRGKYCPIYI